jgi:hypothetical protein
MIAATDDSLGERLRSVAQGAVGALAKALRRQAEAQLQAGTLGRLTEAMTAWVRGSRMDAGSFASHFFGRAADDPVVASLRAAVSEASFATTQAQLAKASGDLAEAMKAVGLDSWPRLVADAQARARDPATVAAIEKSLQPPDLKKDAITPVYPVEKALAVAAAAVTGGAAGLLGSAARAIGGAVASKILGDASAPAGTEPSFPPGLAKEAVPEKSEDEANAPGAIAASDTRFATNAGEAVFWSGRTKGVGGADVAGEIGTSQSGTTLEQLVARKGIDLPVWDASDTESVKAWEGASRAFAQQAKGSVTAVIGDMLRPGNIWETVELPALRANPDVTQIIRVDPATGAKTVIFKR